MLFYIDLLGILAICRHQCYKLYGICMPSICGMYSFFKQRVLENCIMTLHDVVPSFLLLKYMNKRIAYS